MESLMRMLLVLCRVVLWVGIGLQMAWQQSLVGNVTVALMNVSNSRYRFCVANWGCLMPDYDALGRSCCQHSAPGDGISTSIPDNDITTQAYTDNKTIPNECVNYRCRSDQICVFIRQSERYLCQTGNMKVCKEGIGRNNGVKVVLSKGIGTCQVDTSNLILDVPQALRAVARCCRRHGLECKYVSSGPSGRVKNDSAMAECSSSSKVLGCSAYTVNGWLDGIQIIPDYCHAFTGWYSRTGVTSYASCCRAPDLNCSVYTASHPPMGRLMRATCPAGSTLTLQVVQDTMQEASSGALL